MRSWILAALLLGPACVMDRTGQSVTSDWKRQLALQETALADFERRLGLLESTLRARGRQDAEKMDDLEGVRSEVRRLRGELELAQHDVAGLSELADAVRDESDIRLVALEQRLDLVADMLGVARTASPESSAIPTAVTSPVPPPPTEPTTPDGLLDLAQDHLEAGRAVAARAVLGRYITANPQSPRALEARFMVAETHFAEGAYHQAVLAYEAVVQADPQAPWAPRAMLRQGECFHALGLTDEARLFWEDLVDRYPRSEEAGRARDRLDGR